MYSKALPHVSRHFTLSYFNFFVFLVVFFVSFLFAFSDYSYITAPIPAQHAVKKYGGVSVYFHAFLTRALHEFT